MYQHTHTRWRKLIGWLILGARQRGTAPKIPHVIRAEASALMARGSFGMVPRRRTPGHFPQKSSIIMALLRKMTGCAAARHAPKLPRAIRAEASALMTRGTFGAVPCCCAPKISHPIGFRHPVCVSQHTRTGWRRVDAKRPFCIR